MGRQRYTVGEIIGKLREEERPSRMRLPMTKQERLREHPSESMIFALSAVTTYDCGGLGIVTKTGTKSNHPITDERKDTGEAFAEFAGRGGGAERVRTAASQFCSASADLLTTDDPEPRATNPEQ